MPPCSRDEIGDAEAVSATSRERAVVVATCRRAYPALQAIYLFGSRASGAPRPRSDFEQTGIAFAPLAAPPTPTPAESKRSD